MFIYRSGRFISKSTGLFLHASDLQHQVNQSVVAGMNTPLLNSQRWKVVYLDDKDDSAQHLSSKKALVQDVSKTRVSKSIQSP